MHHDALLHSARFLTRFTLSLRIGSFFFKRTLTFLVLCSSSSRIQNMRDVFELMCALCAPGKPLLNLKSSSPPVSSMSIPSSSSFLLLEKNWTTVVPRLAINLGGPFAAVALIASPVLEIRVMAQVSSPSPPCFSAGLKEFFIGLEPNAAGCMIVTAVLVVLVVNGEAFIATKLRVLHLGGKTTVAGEDMEQVP
jgi:hypothetical protein